MKPLLQVESFRWNLAQRRRETGFSRRCTVYHKMVETCSDLECCHKIPTKQVATSSMALTVRARTFRLLIGLRGIA